LYLFTNVEDYESTFYLDKIYPIILTVDNVYSFIDIKIIKQRQINKLPSSQLIIWRKFTLKITGLVLPVNDNTYNYKVKIDVSSLLNYLYSDLYIDKITKCIIVYDSPNYYLYTVDFLQNYDSIYVKEVNYIKSLVMNNYTVKSNININPFFNNIITESIKLPCVIELASGNISIFDSFNNMNTININYTITPQYIDEKYYNTPLNYIFTAGSNNNNIINAYVNTTINNVIIVTNNIINENNFYINQNTTNIFDNDNLYLDGLSTFELIFDDTFFHTNILFNKFKTWSSWSIVTNPVEHLKSQTLNKGNI